MGTDYDMVAERADLCLDRAGPFVAAYFDLPFQVVGPGDAGTGGPQLTGDDIRNNVKDAERYGPGWVEAVARWVDEHGPAYLCDDHGAVEDIMLGVSRYRAWENGTRERFDMGRGEDGVWHAIRVTRPE